MPIRDIISGMSTIPIDATPNGISNKPFAGMLINTKLIVPPAKSKMLPRTHLVDRLSSGKDAKLIIVSGVAGSGKTSLVCQWIRRDALPVAWYSLDRADNDPDVFFRYLLSALGKMDRSLAVVAEPWLQGQKRLTGEETVALLAGHFSDVDRDIYLVLDDYHLIDAEEIRKWLSDLLDYMPPKLHIVVISRHAASASMSRFRVRGQMMEIAPSEMKFTEGETEEFFSEIMPVELSADQVRELARYTDGWVAGLQLFGLSQKRKGSVDTLGDVLNRTCRESTDYLVHEVIGSEKEDVRHFLRTTALLERFNADLSIEVTGLPKAPEILDYVLRNDLFLIPLDTEGVWFRYHHLFSKAVREQAKGSSLSVAHQTYRKAALWLARNDYLEDAFRSAFASEDMEFAADLVEDYVRYMHDRHDPASPVRWLKKLPHKIFSERALLRLEEFSHKMESFQFNEIDAVLDDIAKNREQAFGRYEGSKRTLSEDFFTFLTYVRAYYYRSPAHANIGKLNEGCRLISKENELFISYIKIFMAWSYLLKGDLALSDSVLREASSIVFSSWSQWVRMVWYRSVSMVERMRGNLHRAETILQEAFALLDSSGLSDTPLKFMLYMPMAWVCYHRNDLDNARYYALGAARYGERSAFTRDLLESNLLLTLVCMGQGDTSGADRYLREMRRVYRGVTPPGPGISPDPWIVRFSMIDGDTRYAVQWFEERKFSMDKPFSLGFLHDARNRAELLYRQGSYEESTRILEKLRRLCVDRQMMEAVLEIDLLDCAVLYMLGDSDRAKDEMEKVLRRAETEGYVRLCINRAALLLPLWLEMADTLENPKGASYLNVILSAVKDGSGLEAGWSESRGTRKIKPAGKSVAGLTPREMDVLELMASGCRDREIAEKMFISFHTVRTHVKRIFEKLGVKTRGQAIRRADELDTSSNNQ